VHCALFQIWSNFFSLFSPELHFGVIEGSANRHSWSMEYKNAPGLRPNPLKGLSDTRRNCHGRSVQLEVVRSRIYNLLMMKHCSGSDTSLLAKKEHRPGIIGLLGSTCKSEFAVAVMFFFIQTDVTAGQDTLTTVGLQPFKNQNQLYTRLYYAQPSCTSARLSAEPFDAHCCHMGTAMRRPVSDWVKKSMCNF